MYEYFKSWLRFINYTRCCVFCDNINSKKWLDAIKIDLAIVMGMNFQVWSPKRIDFYKKGKLVQTIFPKK